MIITAIVRKPRRKLVDVYVDGELAITIGAELAVERDRVAVGEGAAVTGSYASGPTL